MLSMGIGERMKIRMRGYYGFILDQATEVSNADAGAPIHNGPEEEGLEDEYEFYTLLYVEGTSSQPQLRRSTRTSRPPQWYGDVLTYSDSYSSSDDDS